MRKIATLFFLFVIVAMTTTVSAQDSGSGGGEATYLKQIADNTYNTLAAVNNVPVFLNDITKMALNWLATESEDEPSFIFNNQSTFAKLGQQLTKNMDSQLSMQRQLMAILLGIDPASLGSPEKEADVLRVIPNLNNMAYSTVLGLPPATSGTGSAAQYISNAAGFHFTPKIPLATWSGRPQDIDRYKRYFETIVAVQSFDSYVLSELDAEAKNGNQTRTLQKELIDKASNSSWMAEIAALELGKVLRDILVFQSQSYVLLTDLLKTQKQLLTAQVMTNTLLITTNSTNESQMFRKAYSTGA